MPPESGSDAIHIRDLALRCVIGIYPEERRDRQDVIINLTLWTDLRRAGQTDDIADTVDYKTLKKQVIGLVESSAFNLVERLAQAIADACLADGRVDRVRVMVSKPGALRFARTVEVDIVRGRRDGNLAAS